jgi:hypothetical protein
MNAFDDWVKQISYINLSEPSDAHILSELRWWLTNAGLSLQSIDDASDDEPKAPDDADWRWRYLEAKRVVRQILDGGPVRDLRMKEEDEAAKREFEGYKAELANSNPLDGDYMDPGRAK